MISGIEPFCCFLVGVWRTATEEWGTEDWAEEVSISGYIYTSVCVREREGE